MQQIKPAATTFVLVLLVLSAIPFAAVAKKMTEAQIEAWLNNETEELPVRKINEGVLRFLPVPPKKKVHHHHNTMIVYEKSLSNGWVKMLQCHTNLDRFPRAQVLYHRKRVKNIRITTAVNIEKAWVVRNSVQLKNVKKGAKLCVEADSKALQKNADGTYTLHNGPFLRRFLDGFFPMQVSVDLQLPRKLRFLSISPRAQNGFQVTHNRKRVHFNAWFEGKLITQIRLIPVK